MSLLELYDRELAAGRRRAAYEAVRAVWRERRAPELAELVERAAMAFGPALPLVAKTQKALVEAWLARARSREPYEARWLVEQLEPLVRARKGSIVAACFDELVSTTDDPSLTLPACTLAGLPGGTVNFGSWGKVLTRLFKLIGNAGDARAIAPLEAIAKTDGARTPSTNQMLAERVPKVVAALRARATGTLDDAERGEVQRALVRLSRPLPPRADEPVVVTKRDTLLAAVLADPDDDRAIAVWGDALQEQGDPRGELVALQLAGAANAKAASAAQKLVTKHWRTWLGPIAPAIVRSSLEFERGLLVACATDVRRKGVADVVFEHENWSTIRRIRFDSYGKLTQFMTWLEEAHRVPESGLEELATTAFPRLHTLSIRPDVGDYQLKTEAGVPTSRGLKALAATAGLPALRTFGFADHKLRTPTDLRWLFETSFASQLEVLTLMVEWSYGLGALGPWLDLVSPLRALRRVTFAASGNLVIDLVERTGTIDFGRVSPAERASMWAQRQLGTARALVEAAGVRFVEPR